MTTGQTISALHNIVCACQEALNVAIDHRRRMYAKHDSGAPELIEATGDVESRERAVRDAWMFYRREAEAQRAREAFPLSQENARPFDYSSYILDLHSSKA
jgi:hypothetical protein